LDLHRLLLGVFEHATLHCFRSPTLAPQPRDFTPSLDEAIVGELLGLRSELANPRGRDQQLEGMLARRLIEGFFFLVSIPSLPRIRGTATHPSGARAR
jgi:hypothetical protein